MNVEDCSDVVSRFGVWINLLKEKCGESEELMDLYVSSIIKGLREFEFVRDCRNRLLYYDNLMLILKSAKLCSLEEVFWLVAEFLEKNDGKSEIYDEIVNLLEKCFAQLNNSEVMERFVACLEIVFFSGLLSSFSIIVCIKIYEQLPNDYICSKIGEFYGFCQHLVKFPQRFGREIEEAIVRLVLVIRRCKLALEGMNAALRCGDLEGLIECEESELGERVIVVLGRRGTGTDEPADDEFEEDEDEEEY
jgi:hypothetical protein